MNLNELGIGLLESVKAMSGRMMAILPTVPALASLDPDDLRPLNEAALRWFITAVCIDQRQPETRDAEFVRATVAARDALGYGREAYIQAIPAMLGEVYATAAAVAVAKRLPDGVLASMLSGFHRWTNWFGQELSEFFRREAEDAARADEHRRNRVLDALLLGVPSAAVLDEARNLGLRLGRPYQPLRARAADDRGVAALERAMHDAGCVVGIVGGDLCGIAPTPPVLDGVDAVVALGPPADLNALVSAFAIAGRVFEAARAFGFGGVVTVADLGPLLAVAGDDVVGDSLEARYLAPLDALGAFGATVTESVRAFLDHGLRVDAAAAATYVHPNTLRYRLAKFADATGADLADTTTVVEVWWALQRRTVDRELS